MPASCKPQRSAGPQKPHTFTLRSSLRSSAPSRSRKVSLTETYHVATTCRMKLGREAARAEHELRRLVCHANMLDSLMEELSDRERGLEGRLNALIRAAPAPHQAKKVQWIDTIVEQLEEVETDSDSNDSSDDDSDIDEEYVPSCRPRKAKSPIPKLWASYFASQARDPPSEKTDVAEQDADADNSGLFLRRWPSRGSIPGLLSHDGRSESDDEVSHRVALRSFAEQCSISTVTKPDFAAPSLGENPLATAVVVH